MSEELSNALAGLANQLGISVAQLWDWLQGSGIKAYATSKVVTNSTICIICVVIIVTSLLIAKQIYKSEKERIASTSSTAYRAQNFSEDKEFLIYAFCTTAACGAVVLCVFLPDLMGWLISPEGMVMQELFGRM